MRTKSSLLFTIAIAIILQNCTTEVARDKQPTAPVEAIVTEPIIAEDNHEHSHDFETGFVDDSPENAKVILQGNYSQGLICKGSGDIIFTDEKGNVIYLKKNGETETKLILEGVGIGNNYGWSKDCSKVFFREKQADYSTTVKSVDINTQEINSHPEYGAMTELKALQISDTVYSIDQKTLEIVANYNGKSWKISKDMGNFYKILLSPNGKLLVGHKGATIYLYNTSGEMLKELGTGIATDWSPDSKSILIFRDQSKDGMNLTGSDIYKIDVETGMEMQLTATANVFEMWAFFTSENEITYTDDVHNRVYTLQLK